MPIIIETRGQSPVDSVCASPEFPSVAPVPGVCEDIAGPGAEGTDALAGDRHEGGADERSPEAFACLRRGGAQIWPHTAGERPATDLCSARPGSRLRLSFVALDPKERQPSPTLSVGCQYGRPIDGAQQRRCNWRGRVPVAIDGFLAWDDPDPWLFRTGGRGRHEVRHRTLVDDVDCLSIGIQPGSRDSGRAVRRFGSRP